MSPELRERLADSLVLWSAHPTAKNAGVVVDQIAEAINEALIGHLNDDPHLYPDNSDLRGGY